MMIKEKLFRKIHKTGHLMSFGILSASFLLSLASIFAALHQSVLGLMLLTIFIIPTINAYVILATLAFLKSKGGLVGYFFLKNRCNKIMKISLGEEVYNKMNPKTLYSKEELDERQAFSVFFKLLLKSSLLDLDYQTNWIGNTAHNLKESKIIKDYYMNYYVSQNNPILAKLIIRSLSWRSEAYSCKSSIINANPDGYHFFLKVFDLHPHFNKADQILLTQFFKKQDKASLKKANFSSIHFLSKLENFKLLSQENQHLLLKVFELNIPNRNELIEFMEQKENNNAPIVITQKDVNPTINHESYKNFNSFKNNIHHVYDNKDEVNEFLIQVEQILLFKEQMLGYLKLNDDASLQYFLTQDIDKTIDNCNREINILHKMKMMKHPEIDKNSQDVLLTMKNRIMSILTKMNEQVAYIHKKLEEDLSLEKEVNDKVFSSRLN